MTPQETPEASANQEHRFPCSNCGSDLRFDPGQDRLICDHCGNTEEMSRAAAVMSPLAELDFNKALRRDLPPADIEQTFVTQCPNCGARVEFDPHIRASECPFCATPVVSAMGESQQIKPRGVAPFDIDEGQARKAMNDWLGRLWFAPNGLQRYARKGRKMSGIYVPFWTYDARTKSHYSGMRGDAYVVTRTVIRDGKPMQVNQTKIRWRPVRGRVSRAFDDILVLASHSLPKKYTDALQPWNLGALEPYNPQYLAGFRAEAYQVGLEEGFEEATTIMEATIRRDVRFDIGGDQQQILQLNTETSDVTFKHILLPVWLAAYKYRGKTYRFVVNGQTGQVKGERPYSAVKIFFAVVLGAIAAAILGYLYAQNGGQY